MSIWHTKQEKPERFRDIICKLLQHKYNGRIVYRNTGDNVDFYLTGVERWAYPEDFEKIESKLDIAVKALEKKLKIAVDLLDAMDFQLDVYLEAPNADRNFSNSRLWQFRRPIKEAIKQIKELDK